MKKVIILYTQFLDFDGVEEKIGGIETYIKNLITVAKELNRQVVIIQFANKNFQKQYEDNNRIMVYGISDKDKKNSKILLDKAYEIGNKQEDILIFASSHMNRKNDFKNSVAIQHGIYWDISTVKGKDLPKFSTTFLKAFQIALEIKRNKLVNKTICVDYNYINWYRALTKVTQEQLICIPNFTRVEEKKQKQQNDVIRIIFARRFEHIRGIKIMQESLDIILKKYNNIEFTFAGSGSFEKQLREKYKSENRVNFITYKAQESIDVHSRYDVAVVPSVGSEGTSLSLLEAMSAGCSVIATNVGGMTNIIIDNYNGIICNTTTTDLSNALSRLIESKELREELSNNGYNTVNRAFNLEIWKHKWKETLSDEK